MELMPQWEVDLRGTFRNRIKVEGYQRNVVSLHKAIENFTGETYTRPRKPLYEKMLDVLKLNTQGSEWDAPTMQRHLYFFYKKNYSRSHLSKLLKKLAAQGLLTKTGSGLYVQN